MDTTMVIECPNIPLTFKVWWDRWDGDRPGYGYLISTTVDGYGNNHGLMSKGDDLRLGAASEHNLTEAMVCLLDFFSAFCEGVKYEKREGRSSENSDLFIGCKNFVLDCGIGSDEIAMIREEISPSER